MNLNTLITTIGCSPLLIQVGWAQTQSEAIMTLASASSNHSDASGEHHNLVMGTSQLTDELTDATINGWLTPDEIDAVLALLNSANAKEAEALTNLMHSNTHIGAASTAFMAGDFATTVDEANDANEDTNSANSNTATGLARLGVAFMTFYYYLMM